MLFATPLGEQHVVGALAASYFAMTRGARAIFEPADLCPAEISVRAQRAGASVVGISIVYADGYNVASQIDELRGSLPRDVELWLGGAGVGAAGPCLSGGVSVINTIGELHERLEVMALAFSPAVGLETSATTSTRRARWGHES
jgi:hypothetical protein